MTQPTENTSVPVEASARCPQCRGALHVENEDGSLATRTFAVEFDVDGAYIVGAKPGQVLCCWHHGEIEPREVAA